MIVAILEIIGSLGLFLYGMTVMSDGIQKAAGERLQSVLAFMTRNRVAAVLTGFAMTCLVQSSSATTVMVVSFVNAQLLSLTQAIGVIMGANIGTTLTGWIVAILGFKFNVSAVAVPVIGLGMPLYFVKKWGRKDQGQALIGFGLLFLGLAMLKDSVPDIRSNPEVLEFLTHFTGLGFFSWIIFILVGAVLTVIVQSSSAAMAITLTMAYAGWIDFPTSAAIILGENIGTTVTAFLASMGTSVNARRASRAHLLFNLVGVFWMAFFFRPFLGLVEWIVPGELTGPAGIPARLALFHTLFNITNTLLWISFVNLMTKIVIKLVPDRPGDLKARYELKYISTSIQETPEVNVIKAKLELSKMAEVLEQMFEKFLGVFRHPDMKLGSEVEELKNLEDYTDQMQEGIYSYLIECSKEHLNSKSVSNVAAMMRIVNEMESIGDSIFNLILLAQRRYDKKRELQPAALEALEPYTKNVQDFIGFIRSHLNDPLEERELREAMQLEQEIDRQRNSLTKAARKRLKKGGDVKSELLFIDIVRHLENIGDYAINIAESLRTMKH